MTTKNTTSHKNALFLPPPKQGGAPQKAAPDLVKSFEEKVTALNQDFPIKGMPDESTREVGGVLMK